MKNSTVLVGIILGALLRLSNAEASVASCTVKGYVQLDYVTSDWIEGRIGDDYVGFAYYQNYIYGEIKHEPVRLYNRYNGIIDGTIGRTYVRWYTDGRGHIYGYQPCVLFVPTRP